jgi:hypothetical protein
MANPYTQGNPYLTQMADIGYPQVNYQPSMQDTRMQDQFHNNALQQMQQLGSQNTSASGMNPMALAQALRGLGNDKDRLATSGYGTQSGAVANPSQWTYGADAAQTYNYGG